MEGWWGDVAWGCNGAVMGCYGVVIGGVVWSFNGAVMGCYGGVIGGVVMGL